MIATATVPRPNMPSKEQVMNFVKNDSVKKMKAMSTMVHHLNDLLGVFLTRDQSHQLARSLDVSTIKETTFDALSSVSESGTQAIVSDNIQGREMYLDEQINGFQAEIQDAVTRLFLSSVSVTMPMSDRSIFGLTSSCLIWSIAFLIASDDPCTSDLIIIFSSSEIEF